MCEKKFAFQLKEIIEDIKTSGTASICCDDLIAYLNDVANSPTPVVTEMELEQYKAKLLVWVEQNKGAHLSNLEMFRSVIVAGQNAIRSAFLLNGGAAIAILVFIGKLTDTQQEKIPVFAESLAIFVVGVLAVAMTSGFAYLSQWFYAGDKLWNEKVGFWFNIIAIVIGLLSYGFFISGMFSAYCGFINFV